MIHKNCRTSYVGRSTRTCSRSAVHFFKKYAEAKGLYNAPLYAFLWPCLCLSPSQMVAWMKV